MGFKVGDMVIYKNQTVRVLNYHLELTPTNVFKLKN